MSWPEVGDIGYIESKPRPTLLRLKCVDRCASWRYWERPDGSRFKTNGSGGVYRSKFAWARRTLFIVSGGVSGWHTPDDEIIPCLTDMLTLLRETP